MALPIEISVGPCALDHDTNDQAHRLAVQIGSRHERCIFSPADNR